MDIEKNDETLDLSKLLWKARLGLSEEQLMGAVEAVLFVSPKPVELLKVARSIDEDIPLSEVHDLIKKLQKKYEINSSGIELVEIGKGFQLRTKPVHAHTLKRFLRVQDFHLTPATLEVLAIVAYKQPVSRSDIDQMRGVDSGHLLRVLIDKKLIKVSGRSSEELGRPTLYSTSDDFLEIFQLEGLDSLPALSELTSLVEASSKSMKDIKEVVHTETQSDLFEQNIEEDYQDIAGQLKKISADTEFTKTLRSDSDSDKSIFDKLEEFTSLVDIKNENRKASKSPLLGPHFFTET